MGNDFYSYWQARYDVYTTNTKTTARTSTFKYVEEESSNSNGSNGSTGGTTTPPVSTNITPNANETAASFISRYAQAKGMTEAQAKAEILANYGDIETKEAELETLEADIVEQEAELGKWQARLEGATGTQVKVYQNQVNSNQKDLDALKASQASLQSEIDFYKSVSAFGTEETPETPATEEPTDTTETTEPGETTETPVAEDVTEIEEATETGVTTTPTETDPAQEGEISLNDFYALLNVNGDDEITADEIIKAFNETDDENLKEMLSVFTDGTDVTEAFKLACSGYSYDSYDSWNKGITLNTDDTDLIASNGMITKDTLGLLQVAAYQVSKVKQGADDSLLNNLIDTIVQFNRSGAELNDEMKASVENIISLMSSTVKSKELLISAHSQTLVDSMQAVLNPSVADPAQEAIDRVKELYSSQLPEGEFDFLREDETARLQSFMDNDTILKLNAAGVSAEQMEELLNELFPTLNYSNDLNDYEGTGMAVNTITVKMDCEKFIKQIYACYGEDSPFLSDEGKAIGRVLNIYSENPNSSVGQLSEDERYGLFKENDTINKLRAAGVPDFTIESMVKSMFPASAEIEINDDGSIDETTYSYSVDGSVTKTEVRTGADGNIIREKTSTTLNDITNTYEEKFDESGNIFEAITEMFIGDDPSTCEYRRFVEKFDEQGNVTSTESELEIGHDIKIKLPANAGKIESTVVNEDSTLTVEASGVIYSFNADGSLISANLKLDTLFNLANTNEDDEITADEIIQLFNETKNEQLKEMLSVFTDGTDVTEAFKLACSGYSYDSYESWNTGITLNTDDTDLISSNGMITKDTLGLLQVAAYQVSNVKEGADDTLLNNLIDTIVQFNRSGAELNDEMRASVENIISLIGSTVESKELLISAHSQILVDNMNSVLNPLVIDPAQEAIESVRELYASQLPEGEFDYTCEEETARLQSFMDNDTILKLNAAGVSAEQMEELLNELFPTLHNSNSFAKYSDTPPPLMMTALVDAEKFIKQMYACYGEESPLLSDEGKAIGRVLNIYSENPNGSVGKLSQEERYALFTENDTVNKLKAAGVPDSTIESMVLSMFNFEKVTEIGIEISTDYLED